MPKLLLGCHVVLLTVLSALVFSSAALHLSAGSGALAPSIAWLAVTAVALSFVMAITEVFSGVRWPPLAALAAAVVGLMALSEQAEVPAISTWSWAVAWGSVVLWFAVLAARARRNR
ncbi:MAG: hypothetical protein U1D00_02365 [Mycobacterium sp.]|nr:hypothetical protein [Mycobacterium sp.]